MRARNGGEEETGSVTTKEERKEESTTGTSASLSPNLRDKQESTYEMITNWRRYLKGRFNIDE